MAKTKVTTLNRFIMDELGLPFTIGYPVFSLLDHNSDYKTYLKLSPRSDMPFSYKKGMVDVLITDRGAQPYTITVKPENINFVARVATHTMSRLFTCHVNCVRDEVFSKIKFYDRRYNWCEPFFHGETPCDFKDYIEIVRRTSQVGNWLRFVENEGIAGVCQKFHTKTFNSLCVSEYWKSKSSFVDRRFNKQEYLSKATEVCEEFLTKFDHDARLAKAYAWELSTITDEEYLDDPGMAVKLYESAVRPIVQYEGDISFHVS